MQNKSCMSRENFQIQTGLLTTSRGKVGYRMCGQSSAYVLIFFHQTPSTSVKFEDMMSNLAMTHMCLALDTPGFGGSSEIQIEAISCLESIALTLVEAIQLWMNDLIVLIGHHTGASLATCISTHILSETMVLLAPPSVPQSQL